MLAQYPMSHTDKHLAKAAQEYIYSLKWEIKQNCRVAESRGIDLISALGLQTDDGPPSPRETIIEAFHILAGTVIQITEQPETFAPLVSSILLKADDLIELSIINQNPVEAEKHPLFVTGSRIALKRRGSPGLLQVVLTMIATKESRRIFTIPELRSAIGIEGSKYPYFRNLRFHVLDPALNELSEHFRLSLSMEEIHRGRSVVGVEFRLLDVNVDDAALESPQAQPAAQP